MKTLLASLVAIAAMNVAVAAADLPRVAQPPVIAPIPVFIWSGFYAGFNAGYGFNVKDEPSLTYVYANGGSGLFSPNSQGNPAVPGTVTFDNRHSHDGFTGGGQIGYNYQFTPGSGVVVGIEADAQYLGFGQGRNRFSGPVDEAGNALYVNPNYTLVNPNGTSGLDFFGTVRGRLGYAFDRMLFYGTGGLAYGSGGGGEHSLPGIGAEDIRTGYAVGGGLEYALPTDSFLNFFRSSAVTLKLEALYIDIDRKTNATGIFAVNPSNGAALTVNDNAVTQTRGYAHRPSDDFAIVRGGVNYKFGSY